MGRPYGGALRGSAEAAFWLTARLVFWVTGWSPRAFGAAGSDTSVQR
jgi:hypothetical protein